MNQRNPKISDPLSGQEYIIGQQILDPEAVKRADEQWVLDRARDRKNRWGQGRPTDASKPAPQPRNYKLSSEED